MPKPKKPDPFGVGCYLIQTADQIGEAINPDRNPYLDERVPVDPFRGIMEGCTVLDRLTEHMLRGLLGLGQRLVDWWRNLPTGDRPTPTPGPEYPVTPGPTATPTPPKPVDDTGHARDSGRDPQCAHGRPPTAGYCTADGKWVSPTPTSDSTATATPTRVPPPSPTPTPTPAATPNPYTPPYVPPPPPPTPEPTPEPTPTPNPDPPKPRPRGLNNHCVSVSSTYPNDPLGAYLACMARGGWTP